MDTSLCTFHRVLGGPLSLVKKTDCHLPCNNIFLIFTTWYLRSHQSPHLESPSEGVAVARLCGRIPARNPAGEGMARGRWAAVTLLLWLTMFSTCAGGCLTCLILTALQWVSLLTKGVGYWSSASII